MKQVNFDFYFLIYVFSSYFPLADGRGPINPKGLQFYNNFINELISHGCLQNLIYDYDNNFQVKDKGSRLSSLPIKKVYFRPVIIR